VGELTCYSHHVIGWATEKSHLDTRQRQGLVPTLSICRLKDKPDTENPLSLSFLFGNRSAIGRYLKGGELDEFRFSFGAWEIHSETSVRSWLGRRQPSLSLSLWLTGGPGMYLC
jgi:hypothetical protein